MASFWTESTHSAPRAPARVDLSVERLLSGVELRRGYLQSPSKRTAGYLFGNEIEMGALSAHFSSN